MKVIDEKGTQKRKKHKDREKNKGLAQARVKVREINDFAVCLT